MQNDSYPYTDSQRTATQSLRMSLDDYNGKTFLNIRVWVLKDGQWVPTKRGINIYPKELEDLEDAIRYAKEDLKIK